MLDPQKANDLLLAQQSPRYKRLDQLERYVDGTQYEGREDWLNGTVPLTERAPAIVYPIVKSAISSIIDFVLGEERWPTITSFTSEDDSEFDPRFGLSEDDSDTLDKFVGKLTEQAKLKAVCRELLGQAMTCGTAVPIASVRNGRVCVSTIKAKWCTPDFLPGANSVDKLVIQYPYIEDYQKEDGKWDKRVMSFRRVIDSLTDTTYKPVDITDGSRPIFGATLEVVEHGLGFCPVLWYRFLNSCSTVADIDGNAPHAHLFEELDALNYSLSQKYRASLYCGDPQFVETGVSSDYNPTDIGRKSMVIMGADKKPAWIAESSQPSRGGSVRKKGPGTVWRYESKDTRVEMLTLPGDALQAIADHCVDLRSKLTEALSVVFIDPDQLPHSQQLSGKAMMMLYGRQIGRCDVIREDFGGNCLLPLIDMIMHMLLAVGKGAKGLDALRVPGIAKAAPILQKFEAKVGEDEATATDQWFTPHLDLVWPDYFSNGAQDNLFQVQMTQTAITAGLITTKMAIESLRDIFTFESAEEVLEAIKEEADEKAAKAIEQQQAMAAAMPPQQPGAMPAKPGATPPQAAKPRAKPFQPKGNK